MLGPVSRWGPAVEELRETAPQQNGFLAIVGVVNDNRKMPKREVADGQLGDRVPGADGISTVGAAAWSASLQSKKKNERGTTHPLSVS